jgi:hypothetical protein
MEMNRPSLVSNPHPLIGAGRELTFEPFKERETLRAFMRRTNIAIPNHECAVWHNGHRVPDKLWPYLIPRAGDQIIIRARVHGGGGGGSKIIKTVATLAVLAVAFAVAGPLGGAAALAAATGATTALATSIIVAAVMIGGNLLVNALIPLPRVGEQSGFTGTQLPSIGISAPSMSAAKYGSIGGVSGGSLRAFDINPTYAIAGGKNRARLWEAMGLVFGRHKIVPDLAANSYTQYIGADQYLNQAFHLGLQGEGIDIDDLSIGDTPLANYKGIDIQRSQQDGELTMFPLNVDTIQGFNVQNADSWTQRTTPINTTHIDIELAAQLYYFQDDGGLATRSVSFSIEYRAVGAVDWVKVGDEKDTGDYASFYWSLQRLNSATDTEVRGQVDYGSTTKADHTENEVVTYGTFSYPVATSFDINNNFVVDASVSQNLYGKWVWTPHPHTLGKPWQGFAPDPLKAGSTISTSDIVISGANQAPTRRTVSFNVTKGQYELRIRKNTADIKNTRETNESAVSQILCFQPDEAEYDSQARLAVRIKASAQLQGNIEDLNAIATASCPVWNGTAWVMAQTSNPAWWFLWYARGARKANGDRIYGGGLVDAQLDLDSIKAWALFCDAKNLTFNYVLTQKSTVHSVLVTIARAGRGSYTWQTGKLGIIWDAANLPAVAMIGPYNIKSGTFEVGYMNEATADEIIVNFINPARNWELDTVRVDVPNVSKTNTTVTLDLDGCTDVDMAGREANLIAASQAFHRRRVSWEMDIEGMIATRGDVVQFSHDLTVWGYSGRLIGGDRTTLQLDASVPSDGAGWLYLRAPDNTIQLIQVSTSGEGEFNTLNIVTPLPAEFPVPSENPDMVAFDWAWQFDPLETPGRRIKIVDVQPNGMDTVKFNGIDDSEDYYACEDNAYAYTPPRDGYLLAGIIFDISFAERILVVAEDLIEVTAYWASSITGNTNTINYSINGVPQPALDTIERKYSFTARTYDIIEFTVLPKSVTNTGTPRTETYDVIGLTLPMPTLTGLTQVYRDNLTVLDWTDLVDIRPIQYEVRIGSSWVNSRTIAVTNSSEIYSFGNGTYFVAARFATPWGLLVYGVADTVTVTGATIVRNLLDTTTEHPTWSGYVTDDAAIVSGQLTLGSTGDILALDDIFAPDDILWAGTTATYGTYETNSANIIDIGYPTTVKIDFELNHYAFNFHENILAIEDVLTWPDMLNDSNRQYYSVTPQIRFAGDDAVYGNWVNYTRGLVNARYFDVRVVLETSDPLILPFVDQFTWSVDVPDMIQKGEGVTVSVLGTTISYAKDFHAVPNVQITILDAVDGDWIELTNSTFSSFDITIYNGATAVSRAINWISQGY